MRRTPILLAAILVAIGGHRTMTGAELGAAAPDTADARPGAAAAVHEIAPAGGTSATAFVRSGPGALSIAWQEGSGPGPRPLTRRADLLVSADGFGSTVGSRRATLRARLAAHRNFGGPLALERAGRSSSSHTTAPPFRSV